MTTIGYEVGFFRIGQDSRSEPLAKGPGLRRNGSLFREGTDPEDNPAASAASGRSILCVLRASVVKHNPVNRVNRVKNMFFLPFVFVVNIVLAPWCEDKNIYGLPPPTSDNYNGVFNDTIRL
jgi:hypothetical protein